MGSTNVNSNTEENEAASFIAKLSKVESGQKWFYWSIGNPRRDVDPPLRSGNQTTEQAMGEMWITTTDQAPSSTSGLKNYWPRRWCELSAWLNTTHWRARAHMSYFCETSHWNWKIVMWSVLCSSVVECGTSTQRPRVRIHSLDFLKVRRKIRHVLPCWMRSYDWVSNGIEGAFGWCPIWKISDDWRSNIGRLTVQYQKIMDR